MEDSDWEAVLLQKTMVVIFRKLGSGFVDELDNYRKEAEHALEHFPFNYDFNDDGEIDTAESELDEVQSPRSKRLRR